MKVYLLSGLTAMVASLTIAPMVSAAQTHLQDLAADLNGDGEVTLIELKLYNLDERQS
jgi:hypothetical protein